MLKMNPVAKRSLFFGCLNAEQRVEGSVGCRRRVNAERKKREKEQRKGARRDLRKKSKRSEILGSINSPSLSRADGFASVPLYLLVHWPPPDFSLSAVASLQTEMVTTKVPNCNRKKLILLRTLPEIYLLTGAILMINPLRLFPQPP